MSHTLRFVMLVFALSATVSCNDDKKHADAPSGTATTTMSAQNASAAPDTSSGEEVTKWKTVQTLDYDWAGDGNAYQFTLLIPDPWDDAGEFTKLQITRHGKLVYELTDPSGLVNYQDEIDSEMKKQAKGNLLPSRYLLMLPIKGNSAKPVILVFGWAYGSSPGSLHVIALSKDGIPKEILYRENFEVTALADLNHDSRMELIGKPCYSEEFGPKLLTYDPYQVLSFGNITDAPMALDLPLTKDYNNKNYYGWAGPDCREDVAVVLHPPGQGKPVIMDTKQAEALPPAK